MSGDPMSVAEARPPGSADRPPDVVARERRQGARSSLVGLGGAAISGLFGFLLAVVLARGFGPDGSGAIFTAIGLLTVVSAVCCLGADTGLVWALPRCLAATGPAPDRRAASGSAPDRRAASGSAPDRAAVPGSAAGRAAASGSAPDRLPASGSAPGGLLVVALVPALLTALVVAGVGLALAGPLADRLLPAAGASGPRLLSLALVAVPVTVAMTLLLSAVRASRPIASYAAVQFVLLPVGRPALVGAVALASGGVVAAMAGWALPAVAAVLACVLLVRRPLTLGAAGGLRPGPGDWRTLWSFALPRAVSAAIDSGSMWVGVLLTAALATQADAGVFGGVGRYVLAGQLAMQGLRVAIAPQLSRLLGAGQTEAAAGVHRQATVWSIVLSWPVYLLLALFAPAFLALFGGEFVAGADAMAILAAAMLVNVGLGTVQTVLLMSGRSRSHLVATSAGLLATVGLGVWWIPWLGIEGAAAAWAVGIVVENVVAAVAAYGVIGSAVLSRQAVTAAVVTAVVVGAAGAVAIAVAGRGLPGLLLAAGLLAIAVAAAVTRRRVRKLVGVQISMLRGGGSEIGEGTTA